MPSAQSGVRTASSDLGGSKVEYLDSDSSKTQVPTHQKRPFLSVLSSTLTSLRRFASSQFLRSSPAAMNTTAASSRTDLDFAQISRAWRAFMAYRGLALQAFDLEALSFENLPDADRHLASTVPIRLSHAAEAAEHNADVIERIASLAGITETFNPESKTAEASEEFEQAMLDFPDVVDGLLAIVRDWSSEGEKDRTVAYSPIIQALEDAADDAVSAGVVGNRNAFSVLIPGASLGRLAWELARLGFNVQGVESSYLRLFMCNYILNGAATPEHSLHLYPFAHHTGTITTLDEQLKEVEFPDVNPRALENANFSMVAGKFLDLYNDEGTWDSVATCFFLDSSHSIISCIRRIAKILKVGGVWINHGFLDFKYDDSVSEPSIEITNEELDLVIARCGLRVIRRESLKCKSQYAVNSMMNEEYESTFTVAVRL